MTSPTCARPHCRQAVNGCEEFARLSAPTMEADALSCGWRACRRGADIAEREVIASRRGRVVARATDG